MKELYESYKEKYNFRYKSISDFNASFFFIKLFSPLLTNYLIDALPIFKIKGDKRYGKNFFNF